MTKYRDLDSEAVEMDTAYLHIVTNHIPIIGVPLALFFLILGFWRKSDDLKSASFLVFVLMGIATLATFLLGQGGEYFVEDLAGVSHDSIGEHEDFAKIALAAVSLTALGSLFALIKYEGLSYFGRRITDAQRLIDGDVIADAKSCFPRWISSGILLLALASAGILGYTGKLGGKIRHTEFYGAAEAADEESGKRDNKAEEKAEESGTKKSTDAPEESGKRGRKRRGRDKKN